MDIIQSLREKSLLRAFETPYETRFGMYQLIHEYAAAKWNELASDTEREAVQQRFAEYFRSYCEDWNGRTNSIEAVEALDRLDLARGNLQAVLEHARLSDDAPHRQLFIDISLNMYSLLRIRGPARGRVPAMDAALAMVPESDKLMRTRMSCLQSQSHREAGDPAKGAELAWEAIRLAEQSGDEMALAAARFNLAGIEYAQGHTERAQELHLEALPVFRKQGNRLNEARVLTRMALAAADLDDFKQAIDYSLQSEEFMNEIGDLPGLGFVLVTRGNVYHRHGELEPAFEYFTMAEQIYRDVNDQRLIALCAGNRALMLRQLRRFDEAEPLVLECTRIARNIGDRLTLAKNLMNTGIMYVELERYDEAETALKEAAQLFVEQELPQLQAVCVENLALIAGRRGDVEGALEGFDRAISLCGESESSTRVGIRVARAELLIASDRKDEAAPLAKEALDVWRSHTQHTHRDYFRALAAYAIATGDRASAEEALEVAGKLQFTATDPSPVVRDTLENLQKFSD